MERNSKPVAQMLLLALAGAASFYLALRWSQGATREPDAGVVDAVVRAPGDGPRAASAGTRRAETPEIRLALPERSRVAPDSKGNAFAVLDWRPPPPPPPPVVNRPPAPPPAPVAPPLPFTFVGMMEKGVGKPQAFLAQGEVLLVVGVGDLLMNNTYRVDAMSPQQVVITYLPLNTPQTINTTGRTQ
jgi:hypothetical protein